MTTLSGISIQIVLIQFHDRVEPENIAYTFFLSLASTSTADLIQTYFKLGDLNKQSKRLLVFGNAKPG